MISRGAATPSDGQEKAADVCQDLQVSLWMVSSKQEELFCSDQCSHYREQEKEVEGRTTVTIAPSARPFRWGSRNLSLCHYNRAFRSKFAIYPCTDIFSFFCLVVCSSSSASVFSHGSCLLLLLSIC